MTEPGEVCDGCGRRVPVPKEDRTPRKRGQFNVSVPKDAEENGAEVLRALTDACRDKLTEKGLAYDASTPPYYTLCAVLADWLQHG